MLTIKSFFVLFILIINVHCKNQRNKLLIVSLDGFRADYLSKVDVQNLKRIAKIGVSPKFVKTTFITKTFPTHMSIVTGLYEESHGIISNTMWDRKAGKMFTLKGKSSLDKFWFQSSYPVWISAEDYGIKSGIYFWPGSEVSYDNKTSSKYKIFDLNANFTEMSNVVIDWLTNEDIGLGMMYFNEPDMTSHQFGPFANETISVVLKMDQLIGYMMDILDKSKIKDQLNCIILSDHGMSDQTVYLNFSFPVDIKQLIDKTTDRTPLYGVFAKENRKYMLFKKLVEFFNTFANVSVYLKEEFPTRFHYSNNDRIPDILILAGKNVVLVENDYTQTWKPKGNHGYDNDDDNMNSFIVAKGPDFRHFLSVQNESINQIDIYHLICALLKIKPRPNNGTLKAVNMFLGEDALSNYMNILNSGKDVHLLSFMNYFVILISICKLIM